MFSQNQYKYTSDDVLFQVYADRNDLTKEEHAEARDRFFSKGKACFRASPLLVFRSEQLFLDNEKLTIPVINNL